MVTEIGTPERTSDPAAMLALLARDGAAILTGWEPTLDASRALPFAVFGDAFRFSPEPAVVGGAEHMASVKGTRFDEAHPLFSHVDGSAMADCRPDYFFLLCAYQSAVGGDSFLVDAEALYHRLLTDPATRERAELLTTMKIEQTETDDRVFHAPIIWWSEKGRLVTVRSRRMRAIEGAPDEAEQQDLVDWWKVQVDAASDVAPRFKLQPGDAVCMDNLRMMHGRMPYEDTNRLLYRVWLWTTAGLPIPDGLAISNPPVAAFANEGEKVLAAFASSRY